MEPFFSNALVLTIILGFGANSKKFCILMYLEGSEFNKTPILSHFTKEFGQKQIIYKCTKPLIPSVKFWGHRTFFHDAFLTSCWRSNSSDDNSGLCNKKSVLQIQTTFSKKTDQDLKYHSEMQKL